MAHRFLVKDIAFQAGVATATVDRVLHGRANVRHQTRRRVLHAIEELEQQELNANQSGRVFSIDFIVEAPSSFGHKMSFAINSELSVARKVRLRARTDIRLFFNEVEIERSLKRILRRGSDGVVLMAPDSERINSLVNQLAKARIPVVTFATDLPRSARIGYVGLNNRQAGETAAYLMGRWLVDPSPHILITIRNDRFRGEGDRDAGFRAQMEKMFARPRFTGIVEGGTNSRTLGPLVREALVSNPDISAIYSIGGSNRQIIDVLDELNRDIRLFIAHDLDAENHEFLRNGKIDAVLDHDFRQDIATCCRIFMTHHKIDFETEHPVSSQIRAIFPPMLQGYVGPRQKPAD